MNLRFNIWDSDDDSGDSDIKIDVSLNIDAVRTVASALHGNNTLQSIDISIGGIGDSDDDVISYMKTHYKNFPQDPRVKYYSYTNEYYMYL